MLIRTSSLADLRYSNVTPQSAYLNRRRFLASGAGLAGASLLGSCALTETASGAALPNVNLKAPLHNLLNDQRAPKKTVTTHNNFYEFGTGKNEPAQNAPSWRPDPAWPVKLEGEAGKPRTLTLDQILKLAPLEERIYRMRCVEGWSVVVPWIGIPLSAVIQAMAPTSKAKYVAFESYYDGKIMLNERQAHIPFPYLEGLRMDEAMHPLTILAVGIYGEALPNQNGAPIRLVVPWKYGFKGIKSIVRIRLIEKQPECTWVKDWPQAYGFYSNVNPAKDHPNGSQKQERRLDGTGLIGEGKMINTTLFNGYGAQVASMYSGMDLMKNY